MISVIIYELGAIELQRTLFKLRNTFLHLWTIDQNVISCHVPARRGLRRTALAPGRDETWDVNPLVRK